MVHGGLIYHNVKCCLVLLGLTPFRYVPVFLLYVPVVLPPRRPRIAIEEILRRGDLAECVNTPMTEAECDAIHLSIGRDRPYGTEAWTRSTASRLCLQSRLISQGNQGASDPDITETP